MRQDLCSFSAENLLRLCLLQSLKRECKPIPAHHSYPVLSEDEHKLLKTFAERHGAATMSAILRFFIRAMRQLDEQNNH